MLTYNFRFRRLMKESQANTGDLERAALFYIISENDDLYEKVEAIYDFKENRITPRIGLEGNGGFDFCGSSRGLIMLGYNLFNGYQASVVDCLYNLDSKNYAIAINAINIRFGKLDIK